MAFFETGDIARKAWKTAPLGHSEIGGKRVVKDRKMVVVTNDLNAVDHNIVDIVAYPKPEHFNEFEKAAGGVKCGGPAMYFPGAVGSAVLTRVSTAAALVKQNSKEFAKDFAELAGGHAGPVIELYGVQAHFRTGVEPDRLRRNLATYYGGWKKRCLEEALNHAQQTGALLVIEKNAGMGRHFGPAGAKYTPFEDELRRLCAKLGAQIREGGRLVVIAPRNR